jgi:hypothetical protein
MAHGTPDWGLTTGAVTTYHWADLDELAARLGSVVSFDRRGEAAWYDDFEHGLGRWTSNLGGTGAAADLSLAYKRQGAVSAHLRAGYTSPYLSQISARVRLPNLSRCGLEASFAIVDVTGYITLALVVFTGSRVVWGSLRWGINTKTHEYLDESGVWQTLALNQTAWVGAYGWHTMKLVIDPVNEQYLRFIIDQTTYPAPDHTPYASVDTSPGQIAPSIANTGLAPAVRDIYVDNVILTQNEPP